MNKRNDKFLVQAWLEKEDFEKIEQLANKFQTSKGGVIKMIIKNIKNLELSFKNKE